MTRSRDTQSVTSRCTVVVYHYSNQILDDGADPSDLSVFRHEISDKDNAILNFSYDRNVGTPSGTFSLTLTPMKHWSRIISPGDWLTVSLSQKGVTDSRVRMIGNVDRVVAVEQVQDDGKRSVTYHVTGRDFGKVFEVYSIWFNPYDVFWAKQAAIFGKSGLFEVVGKSKALIDTTVRVFLGGDFANLGGDFAQEQLDAYRIPAELSHDLGGFNTTRFGDVLALNTDDVPGFKSIGQMYVEQGNLWRILKLYSNSVVNELFLEHVDHGDAVIPGLFLRVYPFTQQGFSIPGAVSGAGVFQDLPTVHITGEDILGSAIGTGDHDRVNFFLLYGDTAADRTTNPIIALLNKGTPRFPHANVADIRRHGLRQYVRGTSFSSTSRKNFYVVDIMRGWNVLLKHWFEHNSLLETGTFSVVGRPEIRTGKRLLITDAKFNTNKEFYIEGTRDTWSYPGRWDQVITVTRGRHFSGGQTRLISEIDSSLDQLGGRTDQPSGRR